MTNREQAREAHRQETYNATQLLESLLLKIRANAAREDINWASVGDIASVSATLQDVHDRLYQTGEYATPKKN